MDKDSVLAYFKGDDLAASTWKDKYRMSDPSRPQDVIEETPDDMHMRLAYEFGEVEFSYRDKESARINRDTNWQEVLDRLSEFGRELMHKRIHQSKDDIVLEFYHYFKNFNQIVPQGSIMSNLGNHYVFGSLSNCFGIAPPLDSYGGIMKTDQEIAQLEKRRGGVGTHLNNIRPTMAAVTNASKSSTGVPTYAERFSNTTREVAQEGRRGALMLLLLCKHPDIFRYVTMKDDRSKVTGANVSVMWTDDFMTRVELDEDFLCRFPVDFEEQDLIAWEQYQYNILNQEVNSHTGEKIYLMKIRAKELFDTFVNMAHSNGEPGAAFIDRIIDYSPDGVYEAYIPEVCNPCGEQWFHRYDTCRLIALNFFGLVRDPFTKDASIDWEKLYEISYMQQRLGDNLVDLEVQYIDRILDKILSDPEPYDVKEPEMELWTNIRGLALAGRRTGNGFTALADMLAALLQPYFSPDIVEEVMRMKMMAELDCTIDMAILRGTFEGWDKKKEFNIDDIVQVGEYNTQEELWSKLMTGKNSFFQMIVKEFPLQAFKMWKYGRRNVSWSTVAPTGTVSLMCQTTSGIEPLFKAYYTRRVKVNANETSRIDFTDNMGDSWKEFPILHPKFKEWIQMFINEGTLEKEVEDMTKEDVENMFKQSPWYKSQADDLTWQERIKINSIVQKYTSNSISCTVNLPEDISQETVYNLYFEAWKAGLKGITVYRDKSRTGVLVTSIKQITIDEHGFTEATDRPESLEADYFFVKSNGKEFAVIIGKMSNNPYELFAFESPEIKENMKGDLIKVSSGKYKFVSPNYTIENVQLANHPDERLLCRFVSGMLRHRMNPKKIAEQVDKAEINVVSFGKAVQRVLKAYVPDDTASGEPCPNCNEVSVIYQEGCKRCVSCGYSKC